MNLLLLIGLVGCFLGAAGGLAGTYLAITSADGPRERAFMVRAAWLCWAAVGAYLAALFFVPGEWPLIWLACAIALPIGLRQWSRRQREIRLTEQRQVLSRVRRARVEPDTRVK